MIAKIITKCGQALYFFYYMLKLKLKDKKTKYVLMLPHIGDVCYALSFLKSFKEYHHYSDITIIGREQLKGLYGLYEGGYDKQIYMGEKEILRFIYGLSFIEKFHDWKFNNIINTYPWPRDKRLCKFEQINALNMTKRIIYGLPEETLPQKPHMKPVSNDNFLEYMNGERKIILSPYAQTIPELPMEFWEKLVDCLKNKGYTVYTNVANNQIAIRGTIPLKCSLEEIIAYADAADYFIGVRSGIFDLIVSCRCKIVVFYPGYEDAMFFNLKAWQMNDNIYEIYGEPDFPGIISYIENNEK